MVVGVLSVTEKAFQGEAFICAETLHNCVRQGKLQLAGLCSETESHGKVQDHKGRRTSHLCRGRARTKAPTADIYPNCSKIVLHIEGIAQYEG